jgi:NAD(P)H-hydrate epimerase
MLKVLSARQIKELDAYTIANEPIASIDLMERACRAFTSWFTPRYDTDRPIAIFCGYGNNGGDGLGIARWLAQWNYKVSVFLVGDEKSASADFITNKQRLHRIIDPVNITSVQDLPAFTNKQIIIDAVFGSGLSRPIDGVAVQVIEILNTTSTERISVDIPSGLFADSPPTGVVFYAHHTISFQLPKLSFFLPENEKYVGKWHLVNIGLHKEFLKSAATDYYYLQKKDIRDIRKKRSAFSHKGDYGRALLIAGSYGKTGAAVLAARAAMRSGLGLLTVHSPRCSHYILQTSVPEAMFEVNEGEKNLSGSLIVSNIQAVGIGPGMGTSEETSRALADLLPTLSLPVVLDADALNIISQHPELLQVVPAGSVLTPHPKEFERLAGGWQNDFERLSKQIQLAKSSGCYVVLKGAFTSIATPQGKVYFNSTGNPGMATGGSGDVLAGLLTGLLAQGYEAEDACLLGVFLHGLAGDLAAEKLGQEALIASDIIQYIPSAFKNLDF